MSTRLPVVLWLLVLPAVLVACQANGGLDPEPSPPDRPGEPADPAAGDPNAGEPAGPVNLLAEQERSQLYFDLDRYTQRYMEAREKGDSRTWTSLHASVLTPMVDKNLADLVGTVGNQGAPARYRIIAIRALGFASDASAAVPALVDMLGEKNLIAVNSALVSLYYLASPETPLLPLVALMNHSDADLRSNDALALFAVLRSRRVDGRVPMDSEVREVSGRLIAAVSDPRDNDVRGHAAAALGEIGDPAAMDILVNLLRDESTFVRIRAAAGLGQLGQEPAIPALIELLGTGPSANEARVVVAALDKIAELRGLPCEADVLGTDPERWRSWYSAVKTGR